MKATRSVAAIGSGGGILGAVSTQRREASVVEETHAKSLTNNHNSTASNTPAVRVHSQLFQGFQHGDIRS